MEFIGQSQQIIGGYIVMLTHVGQLGKGRGFPPIFHLTDLIWFNPQQFCQLLLGLAPQFSQFLQPYAK